MSSKTSKVDKDSILSLLKQMALLLKLNEQNVFKIRAFEKARDALKAYSGDWVKKISDQSLTEIPGIGKGIQAVLVEYAQNGKVQEMAELEANLPKGLLEIIQIPGLGPKKARQLVETLKVESIGELEYACKENRLVSLKGFGEKVQTKVLESIAFLKTTQGRLPWVDVQKIYKELLEKIKTTLQQKNRVEGVGAFTRRIEIIEQLEFLVEVKSDAEKTKLDKKLKSLVQKTLKNLNSEVKVVLHYSKPNEFGKNQVLLSSSETHWKKLKSSNKSKTEKEFYASLKLPWIAPEFRETGEEISIAKKKKLDEILDWNDVKGVFHNHTTRSDGDATLEEMVKRAQKLGYDYIGISDHSQTAFYANGLKEKDILAQEKEVKKLQEKFPKIKIFWGIESDILKDGRLDYPDKLLKRFDFVIASVHQRFSLDKKAMTQRILKAIENPYTRFVGHVSGRLVLGRPPYEVDMDQLIQAAAKNNTAIEINANPKRLDLDWRYGPSVRKHQMLTSINPDAHDLAGLEDTIHGIGVARKALIQKKNVINSWSTEKVSQWLNQKS